MGLRRWVAVATWPHPLDGTELVSNACMCVHIKLHAHTCVLILQGWQVVYPEGGVPQVVAQWDAVPGVHQQGGERRHQQQLLRAVSGIVWSKVEPSRSPPDPLQIPSRLPPDSCQIPSRFPPPDLLQIPSLDPHQIPTKSPTIFPPDSRSSPDHLLQFNLTEMHSELYISLDLGLSRPDWLLWPRLWFRAHLWWVWRPDLCDRCPGRLPPGPDQAAPDGHTRLPGQPEHQVWGLHTQGLYITVCITVEPPNKWQDQPFCPPVLFSEVKNQLLLWERGPELRPLLGGCPFLGGSFIGGFHSISV